MTYDRLLCYPLSLWYFRVPTPILLNFPFDSPSYHSTRARLWCHRRDLLPYDLNKISKQSMLSLQITFHALTRVWYHQLVGATGNGRSILITRHALYPTQAEPECYLALMSNQFTRIYHRRFLRLAPSRDMTKITHLGSGYSPAPGSSRRLICIQINLSTARQTKKFRPVRLSSNAVR